MFIEPLRWEGDTLRILDQTKLPQEEVYIPVPDPETLFEAIVNLRIRGAPLLGIAGAFGLYLGIRDFDSSHPGKFMERLRKVRDYLAKSRPTAVNLFWAMDRVVQRVEKENLKDVEEMKRKVLEEALAILEEDKRLCERIGESGAEIIEEEDSILTHCNAGGLATSGYGTALAVIYKAKEQGKKIVVYADETRPLLQGARLTAWELRKAGIETWVICDNTAGEVMREGRVKKVIVGADRIASNGDTANKVGSYSLAVLAKYHSLPFYIAAPFSTIDFHLRRGEEIPIEERKKEEVLSFRGLRVAPGDVNAYNPAFDVVPHHLITAFITDRGIIYPPFPEGLSKLRE